MIDKSTIKMKVEEAKEILEEIDIDDELKGYVLHAILMLSLLSPGEVKMHMLSPQKYGEETETTDTKPKITFPEFARQVEEKIGVDKLTNILKVVIIAYYIKKYMKMKEFPISRFKEFFKEAGWKVPGNLPRDINKSITKGYIYCERKDKKRQKLCYITRSGEKYIEKILGENKE